MIWIWTRDDWVVSGSEPEMSGWDLDLVPLFSWEVSWARVGMTALSFAGSQQNHPRKG